METFPLRNLKYSVLDALNIFANSLDHVQKNSISYMCIIYEDLIFKENNCLKINSKSKLKIKINWWKFSHKGHIESKT